MGFDFAGTTSTCFNINDSTSPITVTRNFAHLQRQHFTGNGYRGRRDRLYRSSNGSGARNDEKVAIPLSGGIGAITCNGLSGGNYTVYGHYSDDISNPASTSDRRPKYT